MVPSEGTVCAEISDRLAAGRAALLDQHGRRASSASVLSAFWHKYDEAIDDTRFIGSATLLSRRREGRPGQSMARSASSIKPTVFRPADNSSHPCTTAARILHPTRRAARALGADACSSGTRLVCPKDVREMQQALSNWLLAPAGTVHAVNHDGGGADVWLSLLGR